jgi:hypothetical protein
MAIARHEETDIKKMRSVVASWRRSGNAFTVLIPLPLLVLRAGTKKL